MGADVREDGPKTFEALLKGNGAKPLPTCSRCGNPATHRLTLAVSKVGDGRGNAVTRHSNNLCEPCAVAVFASFRKAIR